MPTIASYKGYEISYDTHSKEFTADVQDLHVHAASQTELERQIDTALKHAGVFPVQVVFSSGTQVTYGRITSYDPSYHRGWFVSQTGEREKPWDFDKYFLDTEANRAICEQVKTKLGDIVRINKEIEELRKRLEKPFMEHWRTMQQASMYGRSVLSQGGGISGHPRKNSEIQEDEGPGPCGRHSDRL